MKIKDYNKDLLPREKLIKNGVKTLTDQELLAILINTGNRNESCMDLSLKILNDLDNLSDLLDMSYESLIKYEGIKEKKASTIIASFELARRMLYYSKKLVGVKSSKEVYEMLKPKILNINYETFFIIYLNIRCEIIKIKEAEGELSELGISIHKLIKEAINTNSRFIIIAHNHPTGSFKPSEGDKKTTYEIKAALKLIDVKLIDHLIITNNGYYSFLDEDRI